MMRIAIMLVAGSQIASAELVGVNTGHFMMAEDLERFRHVLGGFLEGLRK